MTLAGLLAVGVGISSLFLIDGGDGTKDRRRGRPAPVAVAAIQRGPIELRRTYSGTLEAPAQFVVAPKVAGRVERLTVDLGDPVQRGQVVAKLDDDEFRHLVAQAKAELAVAEATVAEAKSALETALRDLERIEKLRKRGVLSESQLDAARAARVARNAEVEVATAQVARAAAALEAARIRLGYTKLTAEWSGGDEERVVGERFLNEGAMVAANAPILSVVELDPITAVVFVDEKDYGYLKRGQAATLTTDAYPGETFMGEIGRIAPVFQPGSRQARAELTVANGDGRLKPGMFVRATVVLSTVPEATLLPVAALTTRGSVSGVFLVNEEEMTVSWHPVRTGVREGERVEVLDEDLTGRVVTLGQQLLDDGSAITIPKSEDRDG